MKITTGSLEVYKSGIVRTGNANNIKFDFDSIWLEIIFLDSGKDYRVDYSVSDDGNGLKINIFNSNSVFGAGVTKPIKIGTLEDRALWLSYSSSKLSPEYDSWALEYVFYLGDMIHG
jgi:hypothetical protein